MIVSGMVTTWDEPAAGMRPVAATAVRLAENPRRVMRFWWCGLVLMGSTNEV